MKVDAYVTASEDVVALCDRDNPALRALRKAVDRRMKEVDRSIHGNPIRVTDGPLETGIDFRLGEYRGLEFFDELIKAADDACKRTEAV